MNINQPLPESLYSWPLRLLGYLAMMLVSVLLLALVAVRVSTRPLKTLADAAEQLGRDISSPPLNESGPDEVNRAAQAFNTMQRRLQRYIEDRSQVLAAISHDLKTPITRLRLRTEMLEEPTLQEKFGSDLNEMEQMVSTTLDYLRGTESKEPLVSVDLGALLQALQDDLTEVGWRVRLHPSEGITCRGRPLALKRCLGNLIENAARYGQEARVHLEQDDEQVRIVIADRGEEQIDVPLEQLFNPFFRREQSRSKASGGSGLGLGIARNIARAHGGDVLLRKGKEQGLEAVVTLPR